MKDWFLNSQSDRQRTGSPYARIQIYLHVTTESFTEIFGFRKNQLREALGYIYCISGTVAEIFMHEYLNP